MSHAPRIACLAAAAFLGPVATTPARAEGAPSAASGAMPLGTDIRKAPVGAWAQYDIAVNGVAPYRARVALVARDKGTVTLEFSRDVPPESGKASHRIVASNQVAADPGKRGLRRGLIQVDDNEPMEIPLPPNAAEQGFDRPVAADFLSPEPVRVPAGAFKARHFRHRSPEGNVVDMWVIDDAYPLGVVKVELNILKAESPGVVPGRSVWELVTRGKGAKAEVTKPPRPFDQALMMRQATGNGDKPQAGKPQAPPPGVAPARSPALITSPPRGTAPAAGPARTPARK